MDMGVLGSLFLLVVQMKYLKSLKIKKISSTTVAVLGAGVMGLTTAYDLLEKGYEVHIYSEKWSPNLTSNVAAGSWTPHSPFKKLLHRKETILSTFA